MGKLLATGQTTGPGPNLTLAACLCVALDLKMHFTFLNGDM